MVDPRVVKDLVNGWSLAWVVVQDLSDQISGLVCDADIFREIVSIHPDSSVSSFDIRGLKGRFTDNKCVNYDTNRPDVDLVGVTLLSFQDLWSNVVWSSTNGSLTLSIEFEFGCKSEISNFDFHFVIEEKISKFEISMDDSMTVQIFDGCTNLVDITLDL